MKRVVCKAILTITYNPEMDSPKDIEDRVRGEINTLTNRGHLEGCEHGAQIETWVLEVTTAEVEDAQQP